MVRNPKRKTNRGEIAPEVMLAAVRKVKKEGTSIRKVAADFNINVRTLTRYCKKIPQDEIDDKNIVRPSTNVGYFPSRKVFSDEDEKELKQFVLHAADISYGLTSKEIKTFAYNLCVAKSIKCPKSWHDKGCAGSDWFTDFLKRHPELRRLGANTLAGPSGSNVDSFETETETNDTLNKLSPKRKNIEDNHERSVRKRIEPGEPGGQCIQGNQPSFLQELMTLAETPSTVEETPSLDSSASRQQEELPPDPAVSIGPASPSPSSEGGKATPTFEHKLEASLINLMNSQIFFEPPDADRSFFDSLIPSIKTLTEDQKLEFRSEVIGIIRKLKRQSNAICSPINSYGTAPHPTKY